MASLCRCGDEWRIDDVDEAVRRSGGPVALGYPRDQLRAASAVTTTFGENIAASSGSGTQRSQRSRRVCDLITITVMALLIIVVVIWIILAYLHNPRRPDFRVRDFAVTNFSISNHGVGGAAAWEANLTVVNPSRKFMYDLTNLYGFVYYHNTDLLLSLSQVDQPLHLDEKSNAPMTIRTYGTGSVTQDAAVVEDLRQELQRTGAISFGLGIHLKETGSGYQGFPYVYHRNIADIVTIYCTGLKVAFRFTGDIGFGTLSLTDRSSEVSCSFHHCSSDDKTLYC